MTQKRVADDALGKFARFQHDIFERVRKGSLDPETVTTAIQSVIATRGVTHKIYPVTIDHNNTFEQQIAAGNYDDVLYEVNQENFPIKGEGIVPRELELCYYGNILTDMVIKLETRTVLYAINEQGFRPATIEELLAFGARYPELQREFLIVALGSVCQFWDGGRSVACLGSRDGNKRSLKLHYYGGLWLAASRFLVVRLPINKTA